MTDHEVFSKVLDKVNLKNNISIIQFGVASGNTLLAILEVLKDRNITPGQVIGFDSFLGLPRESEGISTHPDWKEGSFNLLYEIKNNTLINKTLYNQDEAIRLVRERFAAWGDLVEFVIGFYSESLTKEVAQKIKPASFIDIDSDLYISAKQALEFLLENNLLLEDCIVRYDDWNIPGIDEGEAGESKAHFEAVEKYGVVFEKLDSESHDAVFRYKGRK